jgi:hypothetical protein
MSSIILWGFLSRHVNVEMLSEDVAYSWTCNIENHDHSIECLWVWHDCNMSVAGENRPEAKHSDMAVGWKPAGVGLHDLISADPLHIEASVYWPACCGMHGFIRDGKYLAV